MAKRHRCEADDCRKLNVGDSKFCADHKILGAPIQDEKHFDPHEATTVMVDRIDTANWGRLDAEIRNAILGRRVHELEIKAEQVQFAEAQVRFRQQQQKHMTTIEQLRSTEVLLRVAYQALTHKIAREADIDPKSIEIDPESGTVKDLSFIE